MKKLITLALPMVLLAGCDTDRPGYVSCDASPEPPGQTSPYAAIPGAKKIDPFRTVYHAEFPGGSLECGYLDLIHDSPMAMKEGYGEVTGQTQDTYASDGGKLTLSLTAPDKIPKDATPSIGVFSTDLDFGPGSVFFVRATFHGPEGPRIPESGAYTNAWSVGVVARTGDERDLGANKRLGITLRFRDKDGILSVQESNLTDDETHLLKENFKIPEWITDKIVRTAGTTPLTITLELQVDRQTGSGQATLTAGTYTKSVQFEMLTFQSKSGPVIKTVGATLANCCAPGWNVKTDVHDFQISVLRPYIRIEPNIPRSPPIAAH
jgi:hypothetical protein